MEGKRTSAGQPPPHCLKTLPAPARHERWRNPSARTPSSDLPAPAYRGFEITSEYLMLFLTRSEFDRYARFNSWGSARETFDWSEMCNVEIPIPDIKIQKSIAEIFAVYNERKSINERLKARIKDICPILIKGSLEEGNEKEPRD